MTVLTSIIWPNMACQLHLKFFLKKKKKLHLKFHMVIGDGQAASYDVEGKY